MTWAASQGTGGWENMRSSDICDVPLRGVGSQDPDVALGAKYHHLRYEQRPTRMHALCVHRGGSTKRHPHDALAPVPGADPA